MACCPFLERTRERLFQQPAERPPDKSRIVDRVLNANLSLSLLASEEPGAGGVTPRFLDGRGGTLVRDRGRLTSGLRSEYQEKRTPRSRGSVRSEGRRGPMSWGCPNQVYEDYCKRFREVCRPGRGGCVLEGRVISLLPSTAGDTSPIGVSRSIGARGSETRARPSRQENTGEGES
jgi:hypothetical protein